jgi:hypothetical protein
VSWRKRKKSRTTRKGLAKLEVRIPEGTAIECGIEEEDEEAEDEGIKERWFEEGSEDLIVKGLRRRKQKKRKRKERRRI